MAGVGAPGLPDSTSGYTNKDGTPTKDFYNWLKRVGSGGVTDSIAFVDNEGASGDGSTCDNAVFQAAHDRLFNAGGGIVFMGPKTYGLCTPLAWSNKVQLVGCGRDASVLRASTSIPAMITWNQLDPITAGTMREFRLDGNNRTADSGLVIGKGQNANLYQIEIRDCGDGLVLVTTQNGNFFNTFVSNCVNNLLLDGFAWNNRFYGCGFNQPDNCSILSANDDTNKYFDLLGLTNDNTLNRHNTFIHCVIERSTDTLVNIIRLAPGGDGGDNLFLGNEIQGTASQSQVYIGADSSNNRFVYGVIEKGDPANHFAFENWGFNNYVIGVSGIGWTSGNWILNHGDTGATIFDYDSAGGGILETGIARSVQIGNGFRGGGAVYRIANSFDFCEQGNDGVSFGNPVFTASGTIVPDADGAQRLGNNARNWSEVHVNDIFADFYRGNIRSTTSLPAPASVKGARSMINDSSVSTFGSVIAGGGSFVVPIWSDGTNWLIG